MKTVFAWIQAVATTLGAPGLFLVAFIDSAAVPLPQLNDLLLVVSVTRRPGLMTLYAAMSTLGSLAGCFVLYGIGRKGGEALLARRFSGPRTARALALFNRYGMLAVLVPALLPPPAPFKLFVFIAGVSRMSPWTFALAVLLGRGFRFFGEALLAVWYGEQALSFVEAHGRQVGLGVGLTVLAGGIGYFLWRRRRTPDRAADYGTS